MTSEHFNAPVAVPPEPMLEKLSPQGGRVHCGHGAPLVGAGALWVSGTSQESRGLTRPLLPSSQEPGHRHPRGPGQPSQQPLPEVPQHCAEDSPELAAVGPQRRSPRLRAGRVQRLPEHH